MRQLRGRLVFEVPQQGRAESLSAKTKIRQLGGCLYAAHPDLTDEVEDIVDFEYDDKTDAQWASDISGLLRRVKRLTQNATEANFPRLGDVNRAVFDLEDLADNLR